MNIRRPLVGIILLACHWAAGYSVFSQESEISIGTMPPEQLDKNLSRPAVQQTGRAAFYHTTFQGRRTASGELFDHTELTAAHKTLPFGTLVRVINLRNNKSVIVRVNDRGPMQPDRVIDVTRRAAGLLGFIQQGMTRVALEIIPLDVPGK
jgi:rare lipoprotein A